MHLLAVRCLAPAPYAKDQPAGVSVRVRMLPSPRSAPAASVIRGPGRKHDTYEQYAYCPEAVARAGGRTSACTSSVRQRTLASPDAERPAHYHTYCHGVAQARGFLVRGRMCQERRPGAPHRTSAPGSVQSAPCVGDGCACTFTFTLAEARRRRFHALLHRLRHLLTLSPACLRAGTGAMGDSRAGRRDTRSH